MFALIQTLAGYSIKKNFYYEICANWCNFSLFNENISGNGEYGSVRAKKDKKKPFIVFLIVGFIFVKAIHANYFA